MGRLLHTGCWAPGAAGRRREGDHKYRFDRGADHPATGRRAFPGDTVSDTIAAVLEHEPDWDRLPPETPESVRALLRRCLRKDRSRRLHDAADGQLELEDSLGGAPSSPPQRVVTGRGWRMAPSAVGILVLAAFTGWYFTATTGGDRRAPSSVKVPPQRFEVRLPDEARIPKGGWGPSALALSRDGSHLAFVASGHLYVRRSEELATRLVAEGVLRPSSPFLSPDGEWLGFESENRLMLVRTNGTGLRTLCDAPSLRGADWAEDGRILMASGEGALTWVSPRDGEVEVVAVSDQARGLHYLRWPQVLPGGRYALATALGPAFDQTYFAVSDSGMLLYAPDRTTSSARELAWVDRQGHVEPASAHKEPYSGVRISPEAERAAAQIVGVRGSDIWLLDLKRDVLSRLTAFRQTVDGSRTDHWSPVRTRSTSAHSREPDRPSRSRPMAESGPCGAATAARSSFKRPCARARASVGAS